MVDSMSKVLEFHEAFGCAIGERPGLPPCEHNGDLMAGRFCLDDATQRFREGAACGDARCLRLALIAEELRELAEACEFDDTQDALDALVDLRYVLDGTVIAFGFHTDSPAEPWRHLSVFEAAFERVHEANMRKLHDGKPERDATGKIVKPAGWVAPDLSDLIV